MTHKTFDLYRCSPLQWSNLPYEDALHCRIDAATAAKDYYREASREFSKVWSHENHEALNELSALYVASDDAIKWNRRFLEEIRQERENNDEINNYECQEVFIQDQWPTYKSEDGTSRNTSVLGKLWRWFTSLFPKVGR